MPHEARMPGLQRGSLYVAGLILFASGVLWLWLHYFAASNGDIDPARSALKQWSLRLHGAAAMAILIVLGILLATHVSRAWAMGRNLATGLAMLATAAALGATGWGLYYAGDDTLRSTLSVAHWLLGVAALPLAATHAGRGRKLISRREPPSRNAALQESDAAHPDGGCR